MAKERMMMVTDLPFVDYAQPTSGKPPRLALIGEAPGADEARLGLPFVGRAGQLLDEALKEAGVDRTACLVGNTFRYRPPDNQVGHFFSSRRAAAIAGTPIDEALGPFNAKYVLTRFSGEVAHLRDALVRHGIGAVIALGGTPLWALTGLSGILKERGRVHHNRLVPALPVVATFHPSYVLRGNRADMPTFIEDVRLARTLVEE